MPTKTAIVVGAGIAGLFAGLFLAKRGEYTIHLVERAPETGGLFGSKRFHGGLEYDAGIHYAIESGDKEIDNLLFENMDSEHWHVFNESLPQGNVFGGRLNAESGCIDARIIGADLHAQGLVELLSARSQTEIPKTLHQELVMEFGPTYTENIYRPAMKKLTGKELEVLAPASHGAFHISRLIVLPSWPTTLLKSLDEFDCRIAHARTIDGGSSITKYYPRVGGIGKWPEALTDRLASQGVNIHTSTTIESIYQERNWVRQVALSDRRVLECDLLVWTVPPIMLERALRIASAKGRPHFRSMLVLHYLFKQGDTVPNLHWISIYDEDVLTYRVTLYDNIRGKRSVAGLQLTVEVLCDKYPDDIGSISDRVKDELVALGLVSGGSRPESGD